MNVNYSTKHQYNPFVLPIWKCPSHMSSQPCRAPNQACRPCLLAHILTEIWHRINSSGALLLIHQHGNTHIQHLHWRELHDFSRYFINNWSLEINYASLLTWIHTEFKWPPEKNNINNANVCAAAITCKSNTIWDMTLSRTHYWIFLYCISKHIVSGTVQKVPK